jgi:hypothetical protein
MKYYTVTGVNKDGTPNTLSFDHVSAWSLNNLATFFAENGVILKSQHVYSIDDKPLYCKDPVTEEYIPNTGQVI